MKSLTSVLIFLGAFIFGWISCDYHLKKTNIAWAPVELTDQINELKHERGK
jgi:hypothetical protein